MLQSLRQFGATHGKTLQRQYIAVGKCRIAFADSGGGHSAALLCLRIRDRPDRVLF